MRILILHGMLHLAGFDHETDHGEMERLERRLRRPVRSSNDMTFLYALAVSALGVGLVVFLLH